MHARQTHRRSRAHTHTHARTHVAVSAHKWPNGIARRQAVVVNLRFECDETRRLGLEGHICELQLTTAAFVQGLVGARSARLPAPPSPLPLDKPCHALWI